MAFPEFFEQAPRIAVHDALARLLGASDDGRIEYGYADAVKLAGHSCPTVAGAWLMVRAALQALYRGQLPERGGVRVDMGEAEDAGTTGVVAQVFTLITGAAAGNGFQGVGGRFSRHNLLRHGAGGGNTARFTRTDSGAAVEVGMDLSGVPADVPLRPLLASALADDASDATRAEFARVWQGRVRRLLLEHADDPAVIQVRPLA
ncbi:hypothetical protein ABB34_03225 [Stenotrophomonas daejeonensis]|uniref:Formylmethanofuran dehydrogenase subunit E domain-containing protein n=1 Tax=Stenotrophomonas daejeonensis TaxID=659018 RepID=A0A0R0E039_9GAMM|nr:hypothetical protein [Stenotrophomonas daejeonensis]KRG87773.1 hypothetical protein ABB34_03225 [Stenotrophomonas daejeonensis]